MSPEGTRVVAYVRRSTSRQALSPEAQRAAIDAACAQRGWVITTVLEETESGAKQDRPKLDAAVALCEAGGADALVAAKLDRLARSTLDFLTLVERARERGWALVVLDPPLDLTTAAGRMFATFLAGMAEWERELIRSRTRDALAVKRGQGAQLGRPERIPAEVRRRIERERAEGRSLPAIAKGLNADGVPTAQGGRQWYPSTVRAVLRQESGEDAARRRERRASAR